MNKILTTTGLTILLVIGGLIGLLQMPVFASNGIEQNIDKGVMVSMPAVTLDEAEGIVLAEFPGATITRVRLHGGEDDLVWRFRFITSDEKMIEARIDAKTGGLTKTEEKAAEDMAKPAVGFNQGKTTIMAQFAAATIVRADLHEQDEGLVWRFRFITSDSKLMEVSIDGTTGQVLMTKELKKAIMADVSFDEAKTIALADFTGATVDRARLKEEDGALVWRFELSTVEGQRVRVEVDAKTGDIVRLDVKSSGSRNGSADRSGHADQVEKESENGHGGKGRG